MKKCPNCGRILHDDSIFCFGCMSEINKRQEIVLATPKKVFLKAKITTPIIAGAVQLVELPLQIARAEHGLAHRLFPLLRAAQQPAYRRENTSGDIRLRPLSGRADCRYIKKRRRKGDAEKFDFILSFR